MIRKIHSLMLIFGFYIAICSQELKVNSILTWKDIYSKKNIYCKYKLTNERRKRVHKGRIKQKDVKIFASSKNIVEGKKKKMLHAPIF